MLVKMHKIEVVAFHCLKQKMLKLLWELWQFLKKLITESPCNLAMSLLGIRPKEPRADAKDQYGSANVLGGLSHDSLKKNLTYQQKKNVQTKRGINR